MKIEVLFLLTYTPMDNYVIADNFSLLAKLMDIHGDNPFKAKSFANAAFQIEKLTVPLQETPRDAIFRIKGIGESTGRSVCEMLDTGAFPLLEEYLSKTPAGILDMMRIKGIGPKKSPPSGKNSKSKPSASSSTPATKTASPS